MRFAPRVVVRHGQQDERVGDYILSQLCSSSRAREGEEGQWVGRTDCCGGERC
jgi:hypothetical protein